MSSPGAGRINVVLDVNVYIDYLGHADGRILLPTAEEIPTHSAAADTLALAFDDRYALFASPHILRNIDRIMHHGGQADQTRGKFIEFIAETCDLTGGAIVDPVVLDYAIGDHEDNNILALAKDPTVDADVIVSSDHHLINLGPAWNGRLMMRPRQFVAQVLRSTQLPSRQTKQTAQAPHHGVTRQPAPRRGADAFPELRGVRLDRYGFGDAGSDQHDEELQR